MPLTNETTRAVEKYLQSYSELCHIPSDPIVLSGDSPSVVTGFIGFAFAVDIRNGDHWRWNQSLSIKDIEISPTMSLSLRKLNSRSTSKCSCNPGYKVWVGTVLSEGNSRPMYFVWCERGEILCLHDLAFLKPFVSASVAADLHW